MAIDYTALKNELQTDPKALGYAANITSGNDQANASLLNQPGLSNETLPLPAVTAAVALSYMVETEFAALTQAQQTYLQVICTSQNLQLLDPVTPYNTTTKTWTYTQVYNALLSLFPIATTTGTNIRNLINQPCSRAQALFLDPTVSVTAADVAKALRG